MLYCCWNFSTRETGVGKLLSNFRTLFRKVIFWFYKWTIMMDESLRHQISFSIFKWWYFWLMKLYLNVNLNKFCFYKLKSCKITFTFWATNFSCIDLLIQESINLLTYFYCLCLEVSIIIHKRHESCLNIYCIYLYSTHFMCIITILFNNFNWLTVN